MGNSSSSLKQDNCVSAVVGRLGRGLLGGGTVIGDIFELRLRGKLFRRFDGKGEGTSLFLFAISRPDSMRLLFAKKTAFSAKSRAVECGLT